MAAIGVIMRKLWRNQQMSKRRRSRMALADPLAPLESKAVSSGINGENNRTVTGDTGQLAWRIRRLPACSISREFICPSRRPLANLARKPRRLQCGVGRRVAASQLADARVLGGGKFTSICGLIGAMAAPGRRAAACCGRLQWLIDIAEWRGGGHGHRGAYQRHQRRHGDGI